MTRSKLFAGIISCLVLLFGGCVHTGSPQPISVAIQGDSATTAKITQFLKENPKIVVPGTQTEYSIAVVEPDPNVDHKIGIVPPDPTVDYKISVIDPKSGNEIPDLNRQIDSAIREKFNNDKK